jgi:hypothetical protein
VARVDGENVRVRVRGGAGRQMKVHARVVGEPETSGGACEAGSGRF